MTAKKKPEPDDAEQSARFVETAQRLAAGESISFETVVGEIASKSYTGKRPVTAKTSLRKAVVSKK